MSPSVNHPLPSRAALVPAMLVGAASINAAGTVAFFAGFRAEGAAIFAGGIGALPSINDRGIVVFWGMRSAISGHFPVRMTRCRGSSLLGIG